MNIIILTVDSPINSFGGLGESIYQMCIKIPNVNFLSFGPGSNMNKYNLQHFNLYAKGDLEFELHNKITKHVDTIKRYLVGNFKKSVINVVHVFDWMLSPLAIELSNELKIPLVYTIALSAIKEFNDIYNHYKKIYPVESQKMLSNNMQKLKISNKIEIDALANAKKVVFVSDYYKKLYDNNSKYSTIYNGINISYYSTKSLQKYTLPGKNKIKILYIGRFSMMKNVNTLLDIVLPKNIDLIFAGGQKGGDINLFNMIKNCHNNPNINIYYSGFLEGEKKKYYLQNVDAVIVPSIHEPFGLVTVETIASGTLLICSRSTGMEEIIREDCCINCGLTEKTIVAAIEKFTRLSFDEKNNIINRALESIKNLTWEKTANSYMKLYNDII